MTDAGADTPPNNMTADHDADPEAMAGDTVTYDWADDPDDEEVTDGRTDPDSEPGEAA